MNNALIFWFTGLSGAGKTTVALGAKPLLEKKGYSVLVLDGDEIRKNLHVNLGFTKEDIKKNNALIAELCAEKRKSHDAIFVSIISPYRESRKAAKAFLGKSFFEIYFSASLETAMKRDVKGLYAKAGENKTEGMIGCASGPTYEVPMAPDFTVRSEVDAPEKSIKDFTHFVLMKLTDG